MGIYSDPQGEITSLHLIPNCLSSVQPHEAQWEQLGAPQYEAKELASNREPRRLLCLPAAANHLKL